MTAIEAVRLYLARAGCAELHSLWLDLDRKYTESELRTALRKCGAIPRRSANSFKSVRPWRDGEYFGRLHGARPGPFTSRHHFTIWRIPAPAERAA